MERHPETTFVSVHFGNNAEELAWVDAALSRFPNLMVDPRFQQSAWGP